MKRSRQSSQSLPADYLQPLVAALSDPKVLAGIRVAELQPVAFQLALYFGIRRDPDTAAVLGGVYERLTSDVTHEERASLVEDLAAAVAAGSTSVLALLPVLQRERDAGVARAAAMAFALRMAAPPDDPLAGPRALRTLLDHAEHDGVRAGLVSALLAMGDARMKPLLAGAWRALSPGAAQALLALPRTHASLLEAEWLLDWLEDADPATFVAVAASLARLPADGGGRVVDLEREMPVGPAGETFVVRADWGTAEAGARLAEKFRSLARRVTDPSALAPALAAWGVKA